MLSVNVPTVHWRRTEELNKEDPLLYHKDYILSKHMTRASLKKQNNIYGVKELKIPTYVSKKEEEKI